MEKTLFNIIKQDLDKKLDLNHKPDETGDKSEEVRIQKQEIL